MLPEFHCIFTKQKIKVINKHIDKVISEYSFLYISSDHGDNFKEKIVQNMIDSKVIIINQFENKIGDGKNKYFIIGFKRTIIVIKQMSITFISDLFSNNSNLIICFLSNAKQIFDQYYKIKYNLLEYDSIFGNDIFNFNMRVEIINLLHTPITRQFLQIWKSILSCISGYLIKQSYSKLNHNRFQDFYQKEKYKSALNNLSDEDYIILRTIGNGSTFNAFLIYEIEMEEIFVLKNPNQYNNEIPKLFEREKNNYKVISHPLLPKYYGSIDEKKSLIIEYINGHTLLSIEKIKRENKFSIIYEILLIIHYFHSKDLIVRDLKPNNIIIDENDTAVMIDFDRIIELDKTLLNDDIGTVDLS